MLRIKDEKWIKISIIVILFIMLVIVFYNISKLKSRHDAQIAQNQVQPETQGRGDGDAGVVAIVKTEGFTNEELREIKNDGYMSYYFRRKYTPAEIKVVWDAVNALFPEYSYEDKLLATKSIIGYHWLVYKTTLTHNMLANVSVCKRYDDLIKKYSELHEIPANMVRAVIAWENSGSEMRRSWAECVGIGQLSDGAVGASHKFYSAHVGSLRAEALKHRKTHKSTGDASFKEKAEKLEADADKFDVEKRHRILKAQTKTDDERYIPECNIEDAVVYLKILYNNYGKRVDLAISAYHNGGLNNNDIIRDYLNRNSGTALNQHSAQEEITSAISSSNLSYVSLWKDKRSRDMLNGSRTVFGEITTPANSYYSLGDESDIYIWKVAAAYGALNTSDEILKNLVKKYYGEWDASELNGMKRYREITEIEEAVNNGELVMLPPVVTDSGISRLKGASAKYRSDYYKYNYYVLPETAGFLIDLARHYRAMTADPGAKIPLDAALESRLLDIYPAESVPQRAWTHLQGAAVEIDFDRASNSDVLSGIVNEFYLHDKVYKINKNGRTRICINPRYGLYFYKIYRDYKDTGRL